MFRFLRIVLLLFVLINVAVGTWLTRVRSTSWERPLRVAIFPIAADASLRSAAYIAALNADTFAPIAAFVQGEAQRYGLSRRELMEVKMGMQVSALPPPAPQAGETLAIMLWSLRLRFWAWRHAKVEGADPDIRMFVLYHDPDRTTRVPHSLGLQKGLIGVVYAFASNEQAPQNNVVIAHELLHTLGATDKYDLQTNQPVHPDGYAEPEKEPLLPQRLAEIMGGRIPLSERQSEMPASLDEMLIGEVTAREIKWMH
ncbi:MAG TPA: hypothetical protein VFA81_11410 [Burkholderiales bacterium]|nr:hypothetical protein [Burkholderiales bacterium]